MRWDALFADLESQWAAQERRELDAEVADRTRAERASAGLAARLAATPPDEPLELVLGVQVRLRGTVAEVGRDWLLVEDRSAGRTQSCLVPFSAVTAVTGIGSRVSARGTSRTFGLGYALRGLSRDRSPVTVVDVAGVSAVGTIDAVGSDVLELAEHPADAARRSVNLTGRRLVPFAAVALVRPA
jgi:hypothetical protein